MTQEPGTNTSWWTILQQNAARSFAAFRAQVDKTGLFPDLKGEAGRLLRKSVRNDGEITKSYMLMCGLSAGIAALGLLQSSTAVVIGAMLISPLMGPIASMGFGFASLDGHQIRDSVKVVAVGAAIGILTGILLTWISPIRNATPEIIARTEPNLLDLAVAVFSGIAGAYATVQQKGATAIGVAIATALMPPLATVGYGLGVANISFALGAFLLFLTNLAAIAFSFALIARLSGAARPIARVEITPRYVLAGLTVFAVLATPLGITLYRVTAEAKAQATVRQLLVSELGIKPVSIAQLQVRWPLRGQPSIDAVVIAPQYASNAEQRILRDLETRWGLRPTLNLQQVVAVDVRAQTRAIVDAAVESSTAGIARDVPPLIAIREAVGLPTQALWVNRAERSVQLVPFAAPGWNLSDYHGAEKAAQKSGQNWSVRVVPPVDPRPVLALSLKDGQPQTNQQLDDTVWAILRWGVQGIAVNGFAGRNATDADKAAARTLADFVVAELDRNGITARAGILPADRAQKVIRAESGAESGVEFDLIRKPAAQQADQ